MQTGTSGCQYSWLTICLLLGLVFCYQHKQQNMSFNHSSSLLKTMNSNLTTKTTIPTAAAVMSMTATDELMSGIINSTTTTTIKNATMMMMEEKQVDAMLEVLNVKCPTTITNKININKIIVSEQQQQQLQHNVNDKHTYEPILYKKQQQQEQQQQQQQHAEETSILPPMFMLMSVADTRETKVELKSSASAAAGVAVDEKPQLSSSTSSSSKTSTITTTIKLTKSARNPSEFPPKATIALEILATLPAAVWLLSLCGVKAPTTNNATRPAVSNDTGVENCTI